MKSHWRQDGIRKSLHRRTHSIHFELRWDRRRVPENFDKSFRIYFRRRWKTAATWRWHGIGFILSLSLTEPHQDYSVPTENKTIDMWMRLNRMCGNSVCVCVSKQKQEQKQKRVNIRLIFVVQKFRLEMLETREWTHELLTHFVFRLLAPPRLLFAVSPPWNRYRVECVARAGCSVPNAHRCLSSSFDCHINDKCRFLNAVPSDAGSQPPSNITNSPPSVCVWRVCAASDELLDGEHLARAYRRT